MLFEVNKRISQYGAQSARKHYSLAPLGRELERGALTLVLNETTAKRVLFNGSAIADQAKVNSLVRNDGKYNEFIRSG